MPSIPTKPKGRVPYSRQPERLHRFRLFYLQWHFSGVKSCYEFRTNFCKFSASPLSITVSRTINLRVINQNASMRYENGTRA